jgi:hypothetical protein
MMAVTMGVTVIVQKQLKICMSDWSVKTMTLDEWIEYLKDHANDCGCVDIDGIDCVELMELLQELKISRQAIAAVCAQNANIYQCRQCPVQEYDVCPNDKERAVDGR